MTHKEKPRYERGFSMNGLRFRGGNRTMGVSYDEPRISHLKRFDLICCLIAVFCVVIASGRSPVSFCTLIIVALHKSNHKRVDKGPTPVLHDQHVNAREQTSTSLWAMLGKWGLYV